MQFKINAKKTVSNYKRSILTMKTDFDKILCEINHFHSNDQEALSKKNENYVKLLHQILAIRR